MFELQHALQHISATNKEWITDYNYATKQSGTNWWIGATKYRKKYFHALLAFTIISQPYLHSVIGTIQHLRKINWLTAIIYQQNKGICISVQYLAFVTKFYTFPPLGTCFLFGWLQASCQTEIHKTFHIYLSPPVPNSSNQSRGRKWIYRQFVNFWHDVQILCNISLIK